MGKHRFRLTDMMPNAWFYKLRDMSNHTRRRRNTRCIHNKNQSSTASTLAVHKEPLIPCHPRQNNSYNNNTGSLMTLAQHISFGSPSRNTKAFDIHLPPNPPRKSPNRLSTHRKSIYKPSISPKSRVSVVHSRKRLSSVWSDSDPGTDQDALYYSISPCSDHLSSQPDSLPSSDPFDEVGMWSSSCSPRFSSSTADIIIDIDQKPPPSSTKMLEKFDSRVSLPPILTKATSKYKKCDDLHQEIRKALHEHHRSLSVELLKHETNNRRRQQRTRKQKASTNNKEASLPLKKEPRRKPCYSKSGPRVKVGGRNSPKLVAISINKMQVINGRRETRTRRKSVSLISSSRSSISESFAVIKCSYDPEKDFRDSMMEMIVEHHIQVSKDLEELLACYLTLNSNEYHHLIVKAFEEIWCDMFSTPVCTAEACR